MVPYSVLFSAVLPVFLLIGLGMGLKRASVLTAEADHCLTRLVVLIFYPSLILTTVLDNPAAERMADFLTPPAIGFLIASAGVLLAWLVSGLLRFRSAADRRTFAFTTGIFNYGYIPIPICALLFDRETVAVLLILNIGVEVAIWTTGLLTLTGQWNRSGLRRLINPPVIALLIAIPLNLTGLSTELPDAVGATLSYLGACAIPLGLLMIGSFMGDLLKSGAWLEDLRASTAAVALRLILIPLFILLLALNLDLSTELNRVLAVQAAMPCAIFMIVLSRLYGGNAALSFKIVVFTTVAAIFTIPLVIRFGLFLLAV